MKTDKETIRKFARRHGMETRVKCERCSTFVFHDGVSIEKTKDRAIIHYETCPKNSPGSKGPFSVVSLSATERAHWSDLFWGIRAKLEGRDIVRPTPVKLEPENIIELGDEDSPFAVLYNGACSFTSLLAIANDGWDDEPYCEENSRYMYAIPNKDGSWVLNVDPDLEGSVFVTVAFWEDYSDFRRSV